MQPFYHINLHSDPPRLDDINRQVPSQRFRDTATLVNEYFPIIDIRKELDSIGITSSELRLWRWQFVPEEPEYIHSDGNRQAAINWSLTPDTRLEFFPTEGGKTFVERRLAKKQGDLDFIATYWFWIKQPEPIAVWNTGGPVIINPLQPHRAKSNYKNQDTRVSLTLKLEHTYQEVYEILDSAGRIKHS